MRERKDVQNYFHLLENELCVCVCQFDWLTGVRLHYA